MKRLFAVLLTVTAMSAFLVGCATEPTSLSAQDTTRYSVENTENFDLLDKVTQQSITCTGVQSRTLADGRLEIVANVKNRETRPMKVQINCVFKNQLGLYLNDETPVQALDLAENSTQAVRFTASSVLAKNYTIRVRAR